MFKQYRRMMSRQTVVALLVGLGLVALASAARAEDNFVARLAEVRAEKYDLDDHKAIEQRLLDDLKYLASDELQGRGIRTRGLEVAAEYVAIQFGKAGLKLDAVDGQPFQPFNRYQVERLGAENRLEVTMADGQTRSLDAGKDYVPLTAGTSGEFEAPLVFAGYGIRAVDVGYDDYKDLDVRGKVVVVLRHEPRQADPDSPFAGTQNSPHAYLVRKISHAIELGAAAVIICSDQRLAEKQAKARANQRADGQVAGNGEELLPFRTRPQGATPKIPVLHVRRAAIDQVLLAADRPTLAELETSIDTDLKPRSFEIPSAKVNATVEIQRRQGALKNVIAVLPGAGKLADETVVVGAHYDHLGMGGGGSLAPWTVAVHNGADDNGSGTVALLEIARQVVARAGENRRRVVFIAFSAEEVGLIGSQHYVRSPVFPLEATSAMVNLDMVGRLRNDRLTVSGVGTAEELDEVLTRLASPYAFNLRKDRSGYGPSDHASFHARGVPVLHFFTGLHSDYHRPTDDYDKINYEGIRRITLLATDVVLELAQMPKPLTRRGGDSLADLLGGEVEDLLGGDRAVLGVRIEPVEEPVVGLKVIEVMRRSAAEEAQVRVDDIIVSADGMKLKTIEELQSLVRQRKPGHELKLQIYRGKIDIETTAQLKSAY